jgi:hypothetical protein
MTIRAPYIKPPFDIPGLPSGQPLGSAGVLLAVVVAALPFNNSQSWSKPAPLRPSVAFQAQRNPALYPNPQPPQYSDLDFQIAHKVPQAPIWNAPYNQNLYGPAPAAPFIPKDFSKPFFPRTTSDATQDTNQLLFTNFVPTLNPPQPAPYFPRTQIDATVDTPLTLFAAFPVGDTSLGSAIFPTYPAPWVVPYNININPPPPPPTPTFLPAFGFSQFQPPTAPWVVPYNINLYPPPAVVTPPFIPVDYGRVFFPRVTVDATQDTNQLLFTNPQPFTPYNFSKPSAFLPAVPLVIQLNAPMLLGQPFTPVDFSKGFDVPGLPPQAQPYNINLFPPPAPQPPVVPVDYNTTRRVTSAPPQPLPLNPNLFPPLPPPPLPKNQNYFPSVWAIKLTKAPDLPLNPNLFPPPPPQFGASYRLLEDHYLATGYYAAESIITEGAEIPFGWPPSRAVDPQNAQAIQAFWNAGPSRGAPIYSSTPNLYRAMAIRVPSVYWTAVPGDPGAFILTGAGAALGIKRA